MSHDAYMPDAALFPRAATGDGSALATLVERHVARLYDLAFRLTGDPARAAEAVASAFTGLATGALPSSPDAPVLALESAVARASLVLASTLRGETAPQVPCLQGAAGDAVAALALLPARDRAILELTARRSLPDATVAALLSLPAERLRDARDAAERAFNAAMLLHRARFGTGECAPLRAIERSREQERLPAAAAHLVTCPTCAATVRTLPDPAATVRALPALPLTSEGADDILWRVTRTLRHETDHTAFEATPIETTPAPTMPVLALDTRAGAASTSARARPRVAARLASLFRPRAGVAGRRREGHSLDRYLRRRSPLRLLLPLALFAALAAAGAEHFARDAGRGRPVDSAATVVTSRSTLPPRPTTVARVAPSPIPEEPTEAPPARPAVTVAAVATVTTAAVMFPTQRPTPLPATPPATATPAPVVPTPTRPAIVAAAPTSTPAVPTPTRATTVAAAPTSTPTIPPTGTTTVQPTGTVPAATPTAAVAASGPQAPPIVSVIPSPALQIPVMVTPQPMPTATPAERIIPPAPSVVGQVPVETPAAPGTASPGQPGTARLALEEDNFDFGLEAGPRTLRLLNTGSGPLEWRIATDSTWLSVAPAAGTIAPEGTAQIEVTIVRGILPAGSYSGTLRVLTNGGDNLVPVTMAVAPSGITVATVTASPPPTPTASPVPSSTRTATAAPVATRATATLPPTVPAATSAPSPTTAPTATTVPSPTRTVAATASPTTA
ncbi:MAG: hypothetical protein AVDCRST_MAG88-3030, partial [uncultured Thermomicrobiales bacterium]